MKAKKEEQRTRKNIDKVVSEVVSQRENEEEREDKVFSRRIRKDVKGKEIILENFSLG